MTGKSRFKIARNPFYALLLLAGPVFVVTACAYGLMTLRGYRGGPIGAGDAPLLQYLAEHGTWLLGVELGVLVIASMAAMLTDDFWQRRAAARSATPPTTARGERPSPGPR
jgi:hypothetical protein